MTALVWKQRPGPVLWEAPGYAIHDRAWQDAQQPYAAFWRPVMDRGWPLGIHATVETAKQACQADADRLEERRARLEVPP